MGILGDLVQLVGGLGLLLLALSMMTDGLRLAAGDRLISILKKSTTPRWRGFVSGVAVTAITQSSSAVTVAAIGFVNAGLMSLRQAVTVIFGTNVGTTITGWIVVMLGYGLQISAYALTMIGVGMAFKLVANDAPRSGFGAALAGLGLFFLGVDFLKDGFEGINGAINFQIVNDYGLIGIFMGVVLGFVATVLVQSSSAAIALILTAAAGGAMMLPTAAAMVVGANIGTTSTAALATIGATPNARRVALAHIFFNVLTGSVALILLIAALPVAADARLWMTPVMFLAAFHTVFNILGVVLIWPWQDRLSSFLETRYRTIEEDEQKPQFLDRTLGSEPELALQALLREVARVDEAVIRLTVLVLADKEPDMRALSAKRAAVRILVREVFAFVALVQQGKTTPSVADDLGEIMRIAQYYLEAADMIVQLRAVRDIVAKLEDSQARRQCSRYVNPIAQIVARTDMAPAPIVAVFPKGTGAKLRHGYHALRTDLLHDVVALKVPPEAVNDVIEALSSLNRMVARMEKAGNLLNKLGHHYENGVHPPAPASN